MNEFWKEYRIDETNGNTYASRPSISKCIILPKRFGIPSIMAELIYISSLLHSQSARYLSDSHGSQKFWNCVSVINC